MRVIIKYIAGIYIIKIKKENKAGLLDVCFGGIWYAAV